MKSEINFITDEQQKQNGKSALNKLDKISNGTQLMALMIVVFNATNSDKGGDPGYMAKEDKEEFWKNYRELKAEYIDNAKKELDDLLCNTELQGYHFKRLKGNIFDIAVFNRELKDEYWGKCDRRIDELVETAS
jgi:hypothetical protein